MRLDRIEAILVKGLRRDIRRGADIRTGPVDTLPLGGMRDTVFVHAIRFEDYGGVDPDGARIGRRPVRKGRVAGIAEERPGRVLIEVSVIATAYARVQELLGLISPSVLLGLNLAKSFPVAESTNRLVSLSFAEFSPSLNLCETRKADDGELSYHIGHMVFQLEGTLHVLVTRRDGLSPGRPTTAAIPPSKVAKTPPRSKAATRTRRKTTRKSRES